MSTDGVQYVERAFAVGIAGRPVAEFSLTAVNATAKAKVASVAMQIEYTRGAEIPTFFQGYPASPYRFPRDLGPAGNGRYITDPGVTFDPGWVYAADGRDITRNRLLLARGPANGRSTLMSSVNGLTAPRAETRAGGVLGAGRQETWTWQIPLQPSQPDSAFDAALDTDTPARAYSQFARGWAHAQTGEMSFSLSEPRIAQVFHESLVAILASRDRVVGNPSIWFQAVNKFQYQAFWLRDSSIMTVALDQAGLHAAAQQNLSSLSQWQQPDGEYISQAGQQDGVGEAIWELSQHAQLTGDVGFARASLPGVSRAVQWVAEQSSSQIDGLLPPVTVGDNEDLDNAQIVGNDIWAAIGLRSAISLAELAGSASFVRSWTSIDRHFELKLTAALSADQRRFGHVTPAIGTNSGNDWGNYQLAYPLPIANPRGSEVARMIAWEQSHSTQGLADYAHPGELHDYLGFPVFQAELSRGGESTSAAINGLYAETAHTTASGEGWEDGPRAFGLRSSTANLAPHGTFAGQFVSLVHNLLVDDTGSRINLLPGVSPAWLAPGDEISVSNAATSLGTVTLHLAVGAHGATLRWRLHRSVGLPLRDSEPLYWELPYWIHSAITEGGRRVIDAVRLQRSIGTLRLRWASHRPNQSLAIAVASLNRAYAQRREPRPIAPASDW